MIPHFTVPDAKLIRTLEGKLVVILNAIIVIATLVVNLAVVGGSHILPPTTMAWVLAVVNGVTMVSRQLLKMVLALQAKTPAPMQTTELKGEIGYTYSPNQVATASASNTMSPTFVGHTDQGMDKMDPVEQDDEGAAVQQEIAQYQRDIATAQSEPGAPADSLTYGLSPDPASDPLVNLAGEAATPVTS